MTNDNFQKLISHFMKFPGIGSRQARRFVYHLLHQDEATNQDLASAIADLKQSINQCKQCFRFFSSRTEAPLCTICQDSNRDQRTLLLVEKDIDLENIHKTDTFTGLYFVLGGLVPILEKNPASRIRIKVLTDQLPERIKGGLQEVIIAVSANAEGDNTAEYLRETLGPFLAKAEVKISTLGRGLSTGTELEYSDRDTIRHALKNRE
jgi:recombination protein RecR